MENRIRIGVSSCLLGQPLRFDGSHKHDRYLTDTLGEYLEFVPVCPEVEAGFPVPRETFRLVGDPENPRFITTHTQVDHTRHKLLILSHSPVHAKRMGKLVAEGRNLPIRDVNIP